MKYQGGLFFFLCGSIIRLKAIVESLLLSFYLFTFQFLFFQSQRKARAALLTLSWGKPLVKWDLTLLCLWFVKICVAEKATCYSCYVLSLRCSSSRKWNECFLFWCACFLCSACHYQSGAKEANSVQCLNSRQLHASYIVTDHGALHIDFKLCFSGGFCPRKLKWSLISQELFHSPQEEVDIDFYCLGFWPFSDYKSHPLGSFLSLVSIIWFVLLLPRTQLYISRRLCPAGCCLHQFPSLLQLHCNKKVHVVMSVTLCVCAHAWLRVCVNVLTWISLSQKVPGVRHWCIHILMYALSVCISSCFLSVCHRTLHHLHVMWRSYLCDFLCKSAGHTLSEYKSVQRKRLLNWASFWCRTCTNCGQWLCASLEGGAALSEQFW